MRAHREGLLALLVAMPGCAPRVVGPEATGREQVYSTADGGREWFLPDDADQPSLGWAPSPGSVTRVSPGIFRTEGEAGQVRLSVSSPSGTAWWRNVEMTGYFRMISTITSTQAPHWEFFARGERHSSTPVTSADLNGGVAAPGGTATWPWYPLLGAAPNVHCLGTAYHGNFYLTGRAVFEKELAHPDGYAPQRAAVMLPGFAPQPGQWFGLKFMARNSPDSRTVHLELWLDPGATGRWQKVTETDDTGAWSTTAGQMDGCDAAPYGYATDEILNWAGPWVTFRSDALAIEFRWLSVREIGPRP
jgi:hypothetical protein